MKNILPPREQAFARSISKLNQTNPFVPDRIEREREALGSDYREGSAAWNTLPPTPQLHPNHALLRQKCGDWIEGVRAKWPASGKVSRDERRLFCEVVGFWLYQEHALEFDDMIRQAQSGGDVPARPGFYRKFKANAERYFELPGMAEIGGLESAHMFACAFQIRRAFFHVFRSLVGGSRPMAELRASIWQSVFSHDLTRYRRVLFDRMGDFATLITGPSGTGKELVARALAFSRFIPFDPQAGGFRESFAEVFFPLNLSALSPTLIESELFGHRRGSFTGAVTDRVGWMEQCPATGSVFLDEIGDVDPGIQVKLLRTLQSRTFQRLGDSAPQAFRGKIIAATNQDLVKRMRTGEFREDLYYRLCSDLITTPSLREQLDDRPSDLAVMVAAIAERLVGSEEQRDFAEQATRWIETQLGKAYAWPGNFRELEQCVRNVLIRGEYRPADMASSSSGEDWVARAAAGQLTEKELLAHYTRRVFQQQRTLEATAEVLERDTRTVRARLPDLKLRRGRR